MLHASVPQPGHLKVLPRQAIAFSGGNLLVDILGFFSVGLGRSTEK